jgi:hypothetical protein
VGNLFHQAFGFQLGEVVAQGGEAVVSGGTIQGLGGLGVQFCGAGRSSMALFTAYSLTLLVADSEKKMIAWTTIFPTKRERGQKLGGYISKSIRWICNGVTQLLTGHCTTLNTN